MRLAKVSSYKIGTPFTVDRKLGMGPNLENGWVPIQNQRTDGADLDALGALAAGRFANGLVLEGGDPSIDTSFGKTNGSDA
jgi:hypothetical protein